MIRNFGAVNYIMFKLHFGERLEYVILLATPKSKGSRIIFWHDWTLDIYNKNIRPIRLNAKCCRYLPGT